LRGAVAALLVRLARALVHSQKREAAFALI